MRRTPGQRTQNGSTFGNPPTSLLDQSVIGGGLGLTWIDNEPYYLISFTPELAFGNFGVGLDVNFRISSKDQKLRPQDFDEGYDYLRLIRYLRYGHKGEDIYARVGVLDYAKLGHGSIMYLYNNSPVYDERRLGSEVDLNFGNFGFETVYSDFARAGVVGVRGHVLPLQFTEMAEIPVLGKLELGATWASDFRSDSRDTSVTFAFDPNFTTPLSTAINKATKQDLGALSIIGFDIGLPILRMGSINSTLYFDYAKIVDFGSGTALGLETNFNGLGLFNIQTRFERRWQGDKYIPSYFDAFYEVERYNLSDEATEALSGGQRYGSFSSKAQYLNSVISPGPGYFGDLLVDLLGFVQVRGMYSKYDRIEDSGILHLGTGLGNKIPMIHAEAGYDKKYIRNNSDVFTLDERSLLYAELGYKPYPFMIVSALYTWTFKPLTDPEGNTRYATEKRITPKVSFVFPL
ncbi:MAG TPA: hypothetical protein VK470_08800 [Bacteroidota bacterium]|nr:hypothetical protein [Bacteroidota bacterium]